MEVISTSLVDVALGGSQCSKISASRTSFTNDIRPGRTGVVDDVTIQIESAPLFRQKVGDLI